MLRIELQYDGDEPGTVETTTILCHGTEWDMRQLDARLKFLHALERRCDAERAVVIAAQAWGNTDADDALAGLAAELGLSDALATLARVSQAQSDAGSPSSESSEPDGKELSANQHGSLASFGFYLDENPLNRTGEAP